MFCEYKCGQEAKYQLKNKKWCCSKSHVSCPEIRGKISKSMEGENGPWFGKKRIDHSVRMTGKNNPMFEVKRPDFSAYMKGRIGDKHPMSGRKNPNVSEANRKRKGEKHPYTSEMNKQRTGEKHPNWNGGSSFEPYSLEWTNELKNKIRERDDYTCQLCKEYGNTVHHIDYNKKHCDFSNLINLCRSCNVKVNKNRELWEPAFQFYMTKLFGQEINPCI
jgi:hypothetical protein